MGLELALDVLEKLQFERPRMNHRFTIEHFGVSTPEQVRRIADLGALVSANVYYVHELADAYYEAQLRLRAGLADRGGWAPWPGTISRSPCTPISPWRRHCR